MLQLVLANDWLCFTDLLNSEILSTQNYSIMPYIPYITVTFHLLFATNQVPRIQYPHAEHDVSTRICLHKNCETLYIHYYVFTCNTIVSFNERFINFSILLYFKILADLLCTCICMKFTLSQIGSLHYLKYYIATNFLKLISYNYEYCLQLFSVAKKYFFFMITVKFG